MGLGEVYEERERATCPRCGYPEEIVARCEAGLDTDYHVLCDTFRCTKCKQLHYYSDPGPVTFCYGGTASIDTGSFMDELKKPEVREYIRKIVQGALGPDE